MAVSVPRSWYRSRVSIPRPTLERIVATALEEDLGSGDLTTAACIDLGAEGRAEMRAREPLVFCGGEIVREVFRQVDPQVQTELLRADASAIDPGQGVLRLAGSAASILHGERVALNFVQRMSGIATRTREFVRALPEGAGARIADTRKTTPGLRALERYAVRCGGGYNHRENLSSAVLIKDNHIAACGGVRAAIERARARAPHTSRITCEVGNLNELAEALATGADVVLLDNFADAALAQAVAMVAGRAIVEVSGGVSLDRIGTIARTGVDVISVGALTHSAGSVDLGLDWL
jgi:nicotinate-nucleotide pyrophosphorylase (carboxylating)